MLNVAVLVSGGGTNLQAILDAKAAGALPHAKIALVLASKPGVYALERASKAGVPGIVVARKSYAAPEEYDAALLAALADVCETHPLSPEALRAIAEVKGKELCEAAQKHLGFSLSGAQSLAGPAAAACGTAGSAAPLGEFFSRAYRALAQYKLTENAAGPVALCVRDGQPYADFGRGAVPLSSLLPQSPGGAALEDVKRELDALVGLAPVKEYVLRLEQNVRVQQRRAAQGLKAGSVAMHMIFTGNPGKYVKMEDTIRSFAEILDGKCDHIPEQCFVYKGAIEDVYAAYEEMTKEEAHA